jgi:hypothetical protein
MPLLLAALFVAIGLVLATPAGAQVGSEFRVDTLPASQPRVAVATGGDFVVVWSGDDGSANGIFGRRFDSTGTPLAGEFQVNTFTTGWQEQPVVAIDGAGNFVVVWEDEYGEDGDGGGIFARRYDSTGAPLGGEFQVNTYTTGGQFAPDVAIGAAGAFVVAWYSFAPQDGSDGGVFGRRFDAAGSPLGGEFQINTNTTGLQCCPSVARDGTGRFVVTWTDHGPFLGEREVFAQRFDAAGLQLGGEFQVDQSTTGYQQAASVATDASGGFTVVWMSGDLDGDGVFARRYDSAGLPLGDEFQVNTYTTGALFAPDGLSLPDVAIDGSGRMVVTWRRTDGDELGVFGRRYDVAGTPQGGEVRVNSTPLGNHISVATNAAGDFVTAWAFDGVLGKRLGDFRPALGMKLLMRDPGAPTSRRVIARFRPRDDDFAADLDPITDGAFLQIYRADGGGDAVCADLPASGWRVIGDPAANRFAYDDPGFANGPCKIVRVKRGQPTRVVCTGAVQALPYSLDETTQGAVAVRFASGTSDFCMEFAENVQRDLPGLFLAKRSAVPVSCGPPPPGCP